MVSILMSSSDIIDLEFIESHVSAFFLCILLSIVILVCFIVYDFC